MKEKLVKCESKNERKEGKVKFMPSKKDFLFFRPRDFFSPPLLSPLFLLSLPLSPRREHATQNPTSKLLKNTKKLLLLALRGTGIDQATAQKILKAWEGSGLADDPNKLRKLLLNRSLRSAGAILFQAVIDAGAAYGAFSWGMLLDNPNSGIGDFPGKGIVQALSFFVTGYFVIGVLSDFFVLGALSFAAASYGANAGAVLDAVREVAGRPSGASAIDKAAAAVNTLRVVAALNEIADLLKKEVAGKGSSPPPPSSSTSSVSTLKTLSAILTLQRAEEKGFDPAQLGLSRSEAAELAAAFARFDANDDMVLQPAELEALCSSEGFELSSAEVAEAARLLDKNGDGLVSFPEFADWYVNKVKPPPPAAAS